jgi:hypothetical protein
MVNSFWIGVAIGGVVAVTAIGLAAAVWLDLALRRGQRFRNRRALPDGVVRVGTP